MATVEEQLTQLVSDRDDLVTNLTTKGISGLTGEETFTELVPEVLNIPSGGGGSTINGQLVNKTVGSSAISKGDFVGIDDSITIQTNDYRISSLDDFKYYASSYFTDISNLIDGDDGTYCTIQRYATFTVTINDNLRTSLNIPSNAIIKDITVKIKRRASNASDGGMQPTIQPIVYYGATIKNGNTISLPAYYYSAGVSSNSILQNDATFFDDNYYANEFGFRFNTPQNASDKVYYVIFNVTYVTQDNIKTITTDDAIMGIANANGSTGDTIQVYIPNAPVGEE